MKHLNKRGFTIIELLIATVTFSLILLIITGAIIQFSRVYYKGVVTSKTQETARSVADELSRAAQFSRSYDGSSGNAYCFGDKVFSYGKETATDDSRGVVTKSGSCAPDFTVSSSNRQLLGESMNLLDLSVMPNADGTRFTISVTVAYGSKDDRNPDGTCKTLTLGGQFCSVSTVTSTVTRRL